MVGTNNEKMLYYQGGSTRRTDPKSEGRGRGETWVLPSLGLNSGNDQKKKRWNGIKKLSLEEDMERNVW